MSQRKVATKQCNSKPDRGAIREARAAIVLRYLRHQDSHQARLRYLLDSYGTSGLHLTRAEIGRAVDDLAEDGLVTVTLDPQWHDAIVEITQVMPLKGDGSEV